LEIYIYALGEFKGLCLCSALPCVGPYSNKAYDLELYPKSTTPISLNFLIFLTFNWNYCSIFHWFKHCETTLAFQQCKVCDTQHCGLGDLNVYTQTNKLHSLVDRWSHFVNEYTHTWFWDVFVHGYLCELVIYATSHRTLVLTYGF
jgi:hypothetical protein